MADEVDVEPTLDAHDSHQRAINLAAGEGDPASELRIQHLGQHVWLAPAVGWDHIAVCLRTGIYDPQHL